MVEVSSLTYIESRPSNRDGAERGMPNEATPWQRMPSDRSIVTCTDAVLPAVPSNFEDLLKSERETSDLSGCFRGGGKEEDK